MSTRRGGESGIALLLAVFLMAVLAAIAAEFVATTRVKAAAERNQRDGIAAYALAQAGYRAALAAIGKDAQRIGVNDGGTVLVYAAGATEGTPAEAKDVPLGDEGGVYSWRVESEDGRFNINAPRTRQNLANLLGAVGLEPGAERDTILDSILDWTDGPGGHRINGAEEDWYRAQDPPYSAKDNFLDVPEELLLVRGMKPVYFTGGEEGEKTFVGLRDLVTICPVPGSGGSPFTPALAPQALLNAFGLARPPAPVALSGDRFFRIVASGRSGTGPERAVLAVVERGFGGTAGAGSPELRLVYWQDNHVPADAGKGDLH